MGSMVPSIVSDNPASFAEILLEERKKENLATLEREINQSLGPKPSIMYVAHQIIFFLF